MPRSPIPSGVRARWFSLCVVLLSVRAFMRFHLERTDGSDHNRRSQVVTALSALLHIPTAHIATIGDMPNDVLMFANKGISIAMGNASLDVQRTATFVTTTNTEDAWPSAWSDSSWAPPSHEPMP